MFSFSIYMFFFSFLCRPWLLMRWILFSFGLIYHRVHSTMRYVLLLYSYCFAYVIERKIGCTVLLFFRCNIFVTQAHILILCISYYVSIILNIIVSYNTPISTLSTTSCNMSYLLYCYLHLHVFVKCEYYVLQLANIWAYNYFTIIVLYLQ
jgi:hypothetical protein